MKEKLRVILMSGIPGSGKSRWVADARVRYGEPSRWSVCSTDDYLMKAGAYAFDPTQLGGAHGACLRNFVSKLQVASHRLHEHGEASVLVVDNTNTTTEEIAPYMALALAYGASVSLVTVRCAPETAAERCVHGVPLRAIRGMADRLAALRLPPYWLCERVTVDGDA